MNLTILALGDIVGRPGREAVAAILPKLKKKYNIDFVIANAENIAHGSGVTRRTVEEVLKAGVDVLTSGNHVFDQKVGMEVIEDIHIPLLRPLNYPPGVPGRGFQVVEFGANQILVINLMGRVFFQEHMDDPFRAIDTLLKQQGTQNSQTYSAIIVDLHAEATSEKVAMGHYLDGRVSCLFGTHTHIPTADARILQGGTGYVSDIGMVGARTSVLGIEKQGVLDRFHTQILNRFEVAEGAIDLSGIVFEVDPKTQKTVNIELIQEIVEAS